MIKRFIPIGITVLLFSCVNNKKNGPFITGELKNAVHQKVYFERIEADKDSVLNSTSTDEAGKFSMPNIATKLDYYLFRTNDRNVAYLILKGGETIHITGDAKNLDFTYSVEGSEETNNLLELRRFERLLSDSLNHIYSFLRERDPQKKDSAGIELQHQYEKTMRNFALNFIQHHPISIVSLSASQYLNKEKDRYLFARLNDTLSVTYPDNLYVQEFARQVANMVALPEGSTAPDFKMKTPDGKEITLSSYRGKVVLLDFWASWCGPCRKENPRMVDLNKKFKGKNFEILGISLDDNPNAWKEAIDHDHLEWTHVSDFKKWDSKVVGDYNINEIPNTVLIDRNGLILAKGLHPDELEIKINEALVSKVQ